MAQIAEWQPQQEGACLRWDLPASAWSKAEWSEDSIRICHDGSTGEWWAVTEWDQCDKRDLDDADIASVRQEFGLDRHLRCAA